jgi:hypothetical protein
MTQFFLLGKCLFEIYEAEDVGMVDMVEGKNPEAGVVTARGMTKRKFFRTIL